jgi:hypothetical protein
MDETANKSRRRGGRRILKGVGIGLLCLVGLAAILFALLLLPPVRDGLIRYALPRATESVPGTLAIEKASWPGLESFEIEGVLWEADGETILSADTVRVDIRLWPLLARDVKARTVIVHGLTVDVPGIKSLFPPDTTGASEDEDDTEGGFPRAGVLPGIPSVAIDSLSVKAPLIAVGTDNTIQDLAFVGGFDFSSGGSAAVRVKRLGAAAQDGSWKVDELTLAADLREGMLGGAGSGHYAGDYPFVFTAESSEPDVVKVALTREPGLAPPDDPGVAARIEFEREGGRVKGLMFDVAVRMPDEDEIREDTLPAAGVEAYASGRVEFTPEFAVRVRSVARGARYFERGMVALEYRGQSVVVDSLAVAFSQGVTLRTAAAIALGDEVRADLETIVLEAADSGAVWEPSGERTGRVVYAREGGDITVANLLVTGAFGDLAADGRLEGGRSGRFDVRAAWSEPPAFLYDMLDGGPGLADSLRAAWAADAPFNIEAVVRLDEDAGRREIAADAALRLPGPRSVAPLLRSDADVKALGPVLGDIALSYAAEDTLSGAPADLDFRMDLTETDWLSAGTVDITQVGDSVAVNEFVLEAEKFLFRVDGAFDIRMGSGLAKADISDEGFLRRFSKSVPDLDVVVSGEFEGIRDSLASREVHASLSGEVSGSAYHIPSLAGTLSVDANGTWARVWLPEGVVTEHVHLDRAIAEFASADTAGLFPADIAFGAVGSEYEFRQRLNLDLGDTVVCRVDTLRIRAYRGDLETAEPFSVTFERETAALTIDEMKLAGSLGEIWAGGHAGPEGVDINCVVALDFPEMPPPGLNIPLGAWPRRFDAELTIPAANDVKLDARIQGFALDDGSVADFGFLLTGSDTAVSSTITLDGDGARLVTGSLYLPAGITAYPPRMAYHGGDVAVNIRLDGYPVMVKQKTREQSSQNLVARVDADVKVSGSARSPAAYVGAEVGFPDWPDMADFIVAVEGAVRPDSLQDSELGPRAFDLADRAARALGIDRVETLVAELTMRRGGSTLLEGSLSYPMNLAFNPFELAPREGNMHATLKSDGLPLEDIDIFLPEGTALDGAMVMDLKAAGAADDPDIDGTISMRDLDVKVDRLVSMLMHCDLRVEGTARRPAFLGDMAIKSGTVSLPEKAKEMHPKQGPSILLDAAWRPQADSAAAMVAEPDSAVEAFQARPPFVADYDIALDIAPGFWLRGEGLEIELEGKLDIKQKKGMPVISGDLNPRRGTFVFLGRLFKLESGTLSFYGQEEINPSLDLTVTSNIEDYRVIIKLTGTLEKPELRLTSDPDLPEGDIMAMIVFGKPLDSLNEGQGNMLQQRTAEIAIAMGAAKLTQSLSGQGGVDVVSVRSARGTGDTGSALVVGKYITPELLVSYEQALKEKSTSYIVLEYMLTRYIKLETLYSNQSKTGLGLSVEKNY